jgi:Flp pilus assembly protein TadG
VRPGGPSSASLAAGTERGRVRLADRLVEDGDRRTADEGAITLFLAVMMVALFAAVGLVVDAGGRVHALQQAHRAAAEAARAASEQLDPPAVVGGDAPKPDTAAAARAARSFLRAAGVAGDVRVSGSTVHVDTHVTYEPVFLSMLGMRTMTLSGDALARPVRGIDQEAQR